MINVNIIGMICGAICLARAAMNVKFDQTDVALLLMGILLFFV